MKHKKKLVRACTVADSTDFVKEILGELGKEYELVILSSDGRELQALEEKWKDILNDEGHRMVRCIPVEMERHINVWKDMKSLARLISVFRQEKPDMVHSITPKAGLLCMIAAKLTRVPVRIHTFTGLIWPTSKWLKRWLLMATDSLTCSCATHIVPEGRGVMNDMRYITDKKMKVLGYGNVRGVNMKYYDRRPEVMELAKDLRRDDLITFLFVGRLVKDKGVEELVEAFERLYNKKPNCRLWMVGYYEGVLDPISGETEKRMKRCDGIEYVGSKWNDELLAYYAAADCFVCPSYREGFPNVVLEAGAMGLPSIVTDINGSREIIIEGENGTIIPPRDVDSLFAAMEEMMGEKEWRLGMGSRARQSIEERFDQRFVCRCLMDYYREIQKD